MNIMDTNKTKWWLAIAAGFLLINGCGVAWFVRYVECIRHKSAVAVTFQPGDGATITSNQTLVWSFTGPVAPADKVGVWTASGPVAFTPAANGRFCWTTSQTLMFEPAGSWADCTDYAAVLDLDEHAAAPAGQPGGQRFGFHTAALELDSIARKQVSAAREATIVLAFSAKADAIRLRDFVTVRDGSKPIAFEVLGDAGGRLVTIRTAPIAHEKAVVTVEKGLPPRTGTRGLQCSSKETIELAAALRFKKIHGESHGFAQGTIEIEFSENIAFQAVKDWLAVEPAIEFAADQRYGWSSDTMTLRGPFEPGKRYKVTMRKGLKPTSDGVTPLAEEITRTVYMPEKPSEIEFAAEGTYLSSEGSQLVALNCVNVHKVKVSAERIYPNNLVHFATHSGYGDDGYSSEDISRMTATREYTVPFVENIATQVYLHMGDLKGDNQAGAYLLSVSADKADSERSLVVVTDIGITMKRSASDAMIWANSLHTLAAISNAGVKVYSRANQMVAQGTTDGDGLVRLGGEFATNSVAPYLVTVESGDDIAYLTVNHSVVGEFEHTDGRPYVGKGCEAFVFTDRGAYRPGEQAHVEAVVRNQSLACPAAFPVNLRVRGPAGRVIRTLAGMLDDFGVAEFTLDLPVYYRSGAYQLDATMPGTETSIGSASIMVEDFVPPQISVKATADTTGTDTIALAVSARHLFGRPAAGLKAEATITYRPAAFASSNWPGFVFSDDEKEFNMVWKRLGSAELDADGGAWFTSTVVRTWQPPSALQAVFCATVHEPGGRAVSASASSTVDIYPFYLGIRQAAEGTVVPAGQPQQVALAAVLPDGSVPSTSLVVKATLNRVTWSCALKRQNNGTYSYESARTIVPVATETLALEHGTGQYVFVAPSAGQYLVMVAESNSGVSASTGLYAGSPGDEWQAWSLERPGRIEMVPDKKTYAVGDTAALLIKAPFAGKALLTIETDHLLDARVIEMTGATFQAAIPLTEAHAPNVYCAVSVIRPVLAGGEKMPHRAAGVVPLLVGRPDKRFEVSLDAPARIEPRRDLTIAINVGDGGSNVQPAEVAVAVVDEAVCSLTDFSTPDPLAWFEAQRQLGVEWFDLYSLLMPELSNGIVRTPSVPGGDGATGGEGLKGRLNPIDAKRFKPVALWASKVMTDARGRATATVKLPEFNGSLRVMVVAVGKDRLGSAQRSVTVKRDLVVRSSLPRFLAPGDICSMPIQLYNEGTQEVTVAVALKTTGPVSAEGATASVVVAPGGSGRLDARVKAMDKPDVASLTLAVRADGMAFEETTELAVRPPAPSSSADACGTVPPGSAVTLHLPGSWLAGTAQNIVWCSGLQSITLCNGLDYLLEYPYGCLEQTVSASFPLLHLADLAAALRPDSMTRADVAQYVQVGILRVLSMQQYNGGFGMWPGGGDTWQWGSVYATHFLSKAARAGFEVPKDQLDEACSHLERILSDEPSEEDGNEDTTENNSDTTSRKWLDGACNRAYACYVLADAGRPLRGWLAWLREREDKLDPSAKAYLAGALSAWGNRQDAAALLRSIDVPAVAALQRQPGSCLDSNARTLALMLIVWLDTDPQAPEVAFLAAKLDALRCDGRWLNTQDNAMALLALGSYAQRMLGNKKPFSAVVSWNNGGQSHAVTDTNNGRFDPVFDATPEVAITNSGPGTLYFAWQSKGIPSSGVVPETDRNISIRRTLFDAAGNEQTNTVFAQGDIAVVKLLVDPCAAKVENLVIEDLLPAGFEIENPNLKTSQVLPWIPQGDMLAAQHVELRDDRALVFIGELDRSNAFYYSVRAVTPGTYVHPPVSIEAMYNPAIRSVSGKGSITVK